MISTPEKIEIVSCPCGLHTPKTYDRNGRQEIPPDWTHVTISRLPMINAVLCGDCLAKIMVVIEGGEPQ